MFKPLKSSGPALCEKLAAFSGFADRRSVSLPVFVIAGNTPVDFGENTWALPVVPLNSRVPVPAVIVPPERKSPNVPLMESL